MWPWMGSGAWPWGGAGVESPVGKWYTHSPQALACFLSRVGTRGHFWTALLLSGHEVILCKVPQPVKSGLRSWIYALWAPPCLFSFAQKFQISFSRLTNSCDSWYSSTWNEKGRDEILCEVQRNEANLTDIYLIWRVCTLSQARGHVSRPRVLTSRKQLPFSVRKLLSLQTTRVFGVSISADSPIQRNPRGTKWKQKGQLGVIHRLSLLVFLSPKTNSWLQSIRAV